MLRAPANATDPSAARASDYASLWDRMPDQDYFPTFRLLIGRYTPSKILI